MVVIVCDIESFKGFVNNNIYGFRRFVIFIFWYYNLVFKGAVKRKYLYPPVARISDVHTAGAVCCNTHWIIKIPFLFSFAAKREFKNTFFIKNLDSAVNAIHYINQVIFSYGNICRL